MHPNRAGRFKASIIEQGVSEYGENKLTTFAAKLRLIQEKSGDQWIPVPEDFEITWYSYLEKKDGSLNTFAIDNLKRLFGWDGRNPFWLEDTDLSSIIVQAMLDYETFDGKTRLKVKFVDDENATGGAIAKADEATRRAINNRLGAKLRANAGGSPAPAPMPSNKPMPVSPAPKKTTVTSMLDAWPAFLKMLPEGFENAEAEWHRVIEKLFPGKTQDDLTGGEWQQFINLAPDNITPF